MKTIRLLAAASICLACSAWLMKREDNEIKKIQTLGLGYPVTNISFPMRGPLNIIVKTTKQTRTIPYDDRLPDGKKLSEIHLFFISGTIGHVTNIAIFGTNYDHLIVRGTEAIREFHPDAPNRLINY